MVSRSHRIDRLLAIFLLTILGWLALSHKVSAHPTLVSANPAPDTIVDTVPQQILLTFSEPVDPVGPGIVVIGPNGSRLPIGELSHVSTDRTTLRASLPASLPSGTFLVRYSVLGQDGHLVTGRYSFSLGRVTTTPQDSVIVDWLPVLSVFARGVQLLGLSLLVGALVLWISIPGKHVHRDVVPALGWAAQLGSLAAVGAGLSWLLSAALTNSTPFAPEALRAAFTTRSGAWWITSTVVASLGYLSSFPQVRASVRPALWILVATILIVTRAIVSHAQLAPYPLASVVISAFHTASAAAVLGSLILLPRFLVSTSGGNVEKPVFTRQLWRRMTPVLAVAFEIAVLSGAYTLWVNVPDPPALLDSAYGRTLLMKLFLVAFLGLTTVSVAWQWSAGRLTLRVHRWTVGLGIAVLLTATILGNLTPPRVIATRPAAQAGTLTLAQHAGPFLVTLQLDPGLPGPNRLTVRLRGPDGRVVDDATVSLELDDGSGPRLVPLERKTEIYRGSMVLGPGQWTIAVFVRGADGNTPPPAEFRLPVPIPDGRVVLIMADQAMNRLRTAQERTSLTSGGPTVETEIRYQAPDRARYIVRVPGREETETVIVGGLRYDRRGNDAWTSSPWPGQEPFRWPNFRYSVDASEVRILGIAPVDGVQCYDIAFWDPTSDTHYRLWVGVSDYLIRRYEMMAPGHYMVGEFDRFDDPTIVIDAPAPPVHPGSPD